MILSLAVHEAGHLSCRGARGVSPRMLLMRSSGGVSIVEGRFKDARGAALFAAGGPVASVLLTLAMIGAVLIPSGSLRTGLLVTAFLNLTHARREPPPVAPTDGYAAVPLGGLGRNRRPGRGERRAIAWSRVVIASGLTLSWFAFAADRCTGCSRSACSRVLMVQHHAASRLSTAAAPEPTAPRVISPRAQASIAQPAWSFVAVPEWPAAPVVSRDEPVRGAHRAGSAVAVGEARDLDRGHLAAVQVQQLALVDHVRVLAEKHGRAETE